MTSFCFLSDGITDATSSRATCSGAAGSRRPSSSNADRSADEIAQAIFNAVSEHAKGVNAFDDQTIVVLKVKGPPGKK